MEENYETTFPAGKLKISRLTKSGKADQKTASPAAQWCVVTFWDPEGDLRIRKAHGVAGLRRHKLLRITAEALQQSFPLSQDLVSFDILGCGLRTLQRDVAHFAAAGVFVPFQRVSVTDRKRRYTYPVALRQNCIWRAAHSTRSRPSCIRMSRGLNASFATSRKSFAWRAAALGPPTWGL